MTVRMSSANIGCMWRNLEIDVTKKLKQVVAERGINQSKLAELANVDQSQISRFLGGRGTLYFSTVCRLLERLNFEIIAPHEKKDTRHDVKFISTKVLSAEDMADGPIPEDYFAVPLAEGEVAAGMGRVPEDNIKSWVLIWRHHESVRFRSNLVAVEIGKGEDSMVPTLHPEDLVAVDRDDFKSGFDPPGNIFLARYPDGDVAIKRVRVIKRGKDYEITFYSDNAMSHPPSPAYSLVEHFQGEINRAVIGRVVWGWSNMTIK